MNVTFDEADLVTRYAAQAAVLFCKFPSGGEPLKEILTKVREQMRLHPLPIVSLESPQADSIKLLGESLGITDWYEKFPKDNTELLSIVSTYIDSVSKKEIQDATRKKFESCLRSGDYEGAEKLLDSLVFIDERNRDYVLFLGNHYENEKDFDKAERIYKRILLNAPRFVKGMTVLANLYTLQGKSAAAETYFSTVRSSVGDCLEEILSVSNIPKAAKDEFPTVFAANQQTSGASFTLKSFSSELKSLTECGKSERALDVFKEIEKNTSNKEIVAKVGCELASLIESSAPKAASEIYGKVIQYGSWLPEDIKARMERLGMDPSKLRINYEFNEKKSKKLAPTSLDYSKEKKRRR